MTLRRRAAQFAGIELLASKRNSNDQCTLVPVWQTVDHRTVGAHKSRQPGKILIDSRTSLRGQGNPDAKTAGVSGGLREALSFPPREPRPPRVLIRATTVQAGSGRKENKLRS